MKILLVTDLYPIENENVTHAISDFAQEWKNQGHEVEVIRPNFIFNTIIRGRKIKDEKLYLQNGIKIWNVNYWTPFWFKVEKKLPDNFNLKNYDVLISHMPCGAILANKLLKKTKIKYVCAVHASDIVVLTKFKYEMFRKKLIEAYNKADKIAARSPILKEKISKIIKNADDKTFVAYSGINAEISEHKPKQQDKLRICTTASLIKRKNIDILLKAAAEADIDNFELTVMGEGKERKNLEKLAKRLKIAEKVKFTGKVINKEVIKNLKESDVFVLVSDNETFGLCYLEAMSAGNIVVAKKEDGIDGIIKDNENGFLVNADVKELAKCLNKINKMDLSERNRLQHNAQKTAKDMTISKAAKEYIQNITKAC